MQGQESTSVVELIHVADIANINMAIYYEQKTAEVTPPSL